MNLTCLKAGLLFIFVLHSRPRLPVDVAIKACVHLACSTIDRRHPIVNLFHHVTDIVELPRESSITTHITYLEACLSSVYIVSKPECVVADNTVRA